MSFLQSSRHNVWATTSVQRGSLIAGRSILQLGAVRAVAVEEGALRSPPDRHLTDREVDKLIDAWRPRLHNRC
jgi:hypothetical protein